MGDYSDVPIRDGKRLSRPLLRIIRMLADQSKTDAEISRLLDGRLSPDAVCKARERYGIPKAKRDIPIPHGTLTGYNRRCRCSDCCAAKTQHHAGYKARKQADGFAGLQHGTGSTYALGCRCEPCRAAGSSQNRRTRIRRLAREAAAS